MMTSMIVTHVSRFVMVPGDTTFIRILLDSGELTLTESKIEAQY